MQRISCVVLFAVLLSSASRAQLTDIPLSNWTVPPYTASAGGIHTMSDISGPRVFVPVRPCRVVDTRGGGAFVGAYGPPIMAANAQRTFDINNAAHCTGIPDGSDAYSLNFTVTQTAGAPGDIRVWPAGNPPPPAQVTSVLNWTTPNATVANAAIVPANASGAIDVYVAGTATHLLIDINGYFAEAPANQDNFFYLTNNSFNSTIAATNINTEGGGAFNGISWGGTAVSGISTGTGSAHTVYGVYGGSNSQNLGSAGVRGDGYYKGVIGVSHPAGNAAGVLGLHQGCCTSGSVQTYNPAGVRGDGLVGVLGLSTVQGVAGSLVASGVEVAWGSLGHNLDSDPTCIGGAPPGSCAPPWAIFAGGNFGASGVKHFLDPHPTDPKLSIAYVALEGPEAGTYFRGRAKFQNGMARIPVPEHFRLVTDPEGLTVQITPIGGMATVAVLRMDLDEIVVQASRNVEFSYLVQGVRATFKDVQPVRAVGDFMPRSADATLPAWLSPEQQKLVIQNGTYRPDGTVNMETARRLGWDKTWEKRSRPAPETAEQ